jgi:hypothetical protein
MQPTPSTQRAISLPSILLCCILVSACGGGAATPVNSPAGPTVSLTANPTTVSSGGSSNLTWSSTDTTGCNGSGGWSGSKATSGGPQSTGALNSTTDFTLTCTGSGGSASQTVTVTVTSNPSAPTVSLTAVPASVASGTTSTLTWSSTNATSCTASGAWSGSKALSGAFTTAALAVTTSYTLTCTGAGGSASSTVVVTVTGSGSGPFPLHVDSTKRYLIDAQGHPFLINGDTPWDLINRLTDAQIDSYLADRQAKGINTLMVELMEHYPWTSDAHVPNNVYGDPPFTTPGDFSTPNEAYMAHVATMLQNALNRGLLVLITPAYAGYDGGNQGWWAEEQANGATKLTNFGKYLATRFSAYPNIVWVQGGDYSPSDHTLIDAIANGIRSVNPTWLQTFHGGRYTNGLDWTTATWLTLNSIYTDASTIVPQANAEYAKSTMPFVLLESAYETGSAGDGALVRPQMYANNLSGATGYLLGYEDLWPFASGWQNLMNSQGALAMKYLGALWNARSWWLLVPDGTGKAAYASDGSFAFAYAGSGSVTTDLSKLAGPTVKAQWYDPTSGAYSAVPGSPFSNTGTRSFSQSAANSAGDPDWVLVLDSP